MGKNVQIEKTKDGYYLVRLHHGTRDEEHTYSDADELLDFVGGFLENDGLKVTNIKKLKKEIVRLDLKVVAAMEPETS